jgi:glycosyltransferase involved in cell wall biosynthesis
MSKALRIVFAAGPGDAFHTFREWNESRLDLDSSHVTYSRQFYDVCHKLEASALVLCCHPKAPRDPLTNGRITIARQPNFIAGKTRLRYQAAHWAYSRALMEAVERFRANVLLVPDYPHLFLLGRLRQRGVSVIQSLHCTLWPPHLRPSPTSRATTALLGLTYVRACDAILSASDEIDRQVAAITSRWRRPAPPIAGFLPHYLPEMYGGLRAPERGPVFRFMYVGRIEVEKGVFNLLEIATRLRDQGRCDIVFEICGWGSALDELRTCVSNRRLEASFVVHGKCERKQLREVYDRSYAVVVPTTVHFVEGFNQVVVEALLAGRPVITSRACPALSYVAPAVLQVPPDDLDAYQRAIVRLADDPVTYERLRAACEPTCRRFLDEETSFGRALQHVLSAVAREAPIESRPLN